MSRIVPEDWMPDCQMDRIITHWTAGGHHASTIDREHYHIIVEADGRLVRGDHSIADNVRTSDNDYAAHTRGLNTRSIGISVCSMLGAVQNPFRAGAAPMTREQYEAMAIAVADLCQRYGIAVTPRTVLGHGEVQAILNVEQRGKWDPMVLPWDPDEPIRAVGDAFRQMVESRLKSPQAGDQLSPVTVFVNGAKVTDEAILKADTCWSPLRPLADALGWTILQIDDQSTRVSTPAGERQIAATIRGDRGFVPVRDLCAKAGFPPPEFDVATRTVRLRSQ
jgi:N-acetylmuramoyl-L-alanine amidase